MILSLKQEDLGFHTCCNQEHVNQEYVIPQSLSNQEGDLACVRDTGCTDLCDAQRGMAVETGKLALSC